jgi:CRP-like cAMP-binding protein
MMLAFLQSFETLIHVGFVATALAFLVRDILWLRLLATLSYSLFCIVAVMLADGPAWHLVLWYLTFITINLGHAAYLLYERSLVKLTVAERRVCDIAFPRLDPVPVKRLLRSGKWVDFVQSECLTWQGKISEYLYLIAEGEASVRVGEQEVARLLAGRFVGEIGFLACRPATATTSAILADGQQACRCLAWKAEKLRRRLARDPAMKSVVYPALGADLAAKIADHNVKVTRPFAVASAEPQHVGDQLAM